MRPSHPDPEMRGGPGSKKLLLLLRPQLGLKIRRGNPPGSATVTSLFGT